MALLIPTRHYLSQKATIEPVDLAQERLVLTEANCPYRQVFETEICARGVNSYSGIEIMSLKALQSMVESGLRIGVMPIDINSPPPKNTVVRTIKNVKLKLPIGIAVLPERNMLSFYVNRTNNHLQQRQQRYKSNLKNNRCAKIQYNIKQHL